MAWYLLTSKLLQKYYVLKYISFVERNITFEYTFVVYLSSLWNITITMYPAYYLHHAI